MKVIYVLSKWDVRSRLSCLAPLVARLRFFLAPVPFEEEVVVSLRKQPTFPVTSLLVSSRNDVLVTSAEIPY